MKISLLAITTLVTSACARNVASSLEGYVHLGFNVSRGNTFEDSNGSNIPKFVKRANEDGSVTMELDNQSTFYSVTLKIGSNDQEVIVLVDTGSSDLWVSSSSNPYCSSSSSSSSSTSSQKFRRIDDDDAAVEILGKENYRKILTDREQVAGYVNSNSKFRKLDDGTALSELRDSSNDDKESNNLLGTKVENKAFTIVTSVASSEATLDCSTYGTFDSDQSSSFKSNDTEFFILYGDSTYALGTWGYDNLKIGDLAVDNLSFAVANQSNSTMGVLGIGLEGLETTNTGALAGSNGYIYSNLPTKLVEDGLINKRVYSLWLNSWQASSGNILFGAVDHAKYEGELSLIPVINTLAAYGYSDPIKLEVTLSGITLISSNDQVTITSTSYPALLDSGTTLTYLPSSIVSSIASSLGATYSSSYGYYLMTCPTSDNVNVTFSFQGIDIQVPLTDIVLSFGSGNTCVLALIPSSDIILGDSFLRSAYVVYDLDNFQIALAQAKYTTDEDIEVITSTIPSATSAASYLYTYGASGVATGSISVGVSNGQGATSLRTNGSGTSTHLSSGSVGSSRTASGRSTGSAGASSTGSSSGSTSSGSSVETPKLLKLFTVIAFAGGLSLFVI